MRTKKRLFSFWKFICVGLWMMLGCAIAPSQQASGRWEVQRNYVNDNEGGYLNIHQSWQPYKQVRYCLRVRCYNPDGTYSERDCEPLSPCSVCLTGTIPVCIQCSEWTPHFHCLHCIAGGGIAQVCNDCLGPVCNPFQAHLPSDEGLPWAMALSGRDSPPSPHPARGDQSASGRTYLKLVWVGEGLPPERVDVRTLVSLHALAVAERSPYGHATASAGASVDSVSVNASASTSGNDEAEGETDLLSRELTVQQDTAGNYYVLVPYSVLLTTSVDATPLGSEDYCEFTPVITPPSENSGSAAALFERFLDLFSAGDTIFLVSGTALVDGAGVICDPDACGLQPATGQIADGAPFPALDAAHSGYAFHSAPSHSSQPLYGLETIRILYDSANEPGDIRLKDFWRSSPVVPTWETFPPPPYTTPLEELFNQHTPKERQITVYDAGGTALRFLAKIPLQGGRWQYEGVQGVFSTLLEEQPHTFVLLGGPPGAMHAPGAWKYTFATIPYQQVGQEQRYSGQSAVLTRIDDPLGNSVTLTHSGSSVTIADSLSGSQLHIDRTSGLVEYQSPRTNGWQTVGQIVWTVVNGVPVGTVAWGSGNEQVAASWSMGAGNTSGFYSVGPFYENRQFEQVNARETAPHVRHFGHNASAKRLTQRQVDNLKPTTYAYHWEDDAQNPSRERFRIVMQQQGKQAKHLIYHVNPDEGTFEKMEFVRPSLRDASTREKILHYFNENGQIEQTEFFPQLTGDPDWRETVSYLEQNPLLVTSSTHYDLRTNHSFTATASYDGIPVGDQGTEWVMTGSTDPSGVSVQLFYGERNNPPVLLTGIQDGANNRWEMDYHPNGLLQAFREPERPDWTVEYYGAQSLYPNKLWRVTDPTNRQMQITAYDLFGRPSRWEVSPSTGVTLWQQTEWSLMGQPKQVEWSDGTAVVLNYQGPMLTGVTDARGRMATFNYNPGTGSLDSIYVGSQLFAQLGYDSDYGRLTRVQGGNNVGLTYGYTSTLDPVGERDALRSVHHDGDLYSEWFTYACCGQIESWTKQDGRSAFFRFSTRGLLEEIRYTAQGVPIYQFTYDNAGRLLSLKDPTTPATQPSTWTYDYTTGRLSQSQTRLPIGGYTWTYQYLPSGEVSQATLTYPNQSSTVWNYEYDDAGRLTTIKRNNQTLATYSYDGAGRLIGQSVAPLSLNTSLQYADSQSVGAVGLLTHTRNGQTIAGFDYRGNPNSPNRADWGYYADGTLHRASESFAGSTRQWEWDYHPDGSLQYEKLDSHQTDFSYDLGGNLTAWGEETGWYYWFNQLTWIPDRLWHYTYTRNGERSRWWTGASQQQLEGDVNRDGQVDDEDILLVMFMYGQSCNGCPEDLNLDGMVDEADLLIVLFNYGLQIGTHLSWEYRYDVWGNLVQAESAAVGLYQAAYDGFGRRAWQEIKGVRTYFVYDGDTIVAELDTNGNPVVEYAWGLLGPIARLDLTNPSNSRYYILDALGHTRLLLDNTGNITDTYVYDAWGNLLKGSEWSSPNPFTWNGAYGYEWIEFTGLFHVGAREYDPRTARWLQRDPIDVAGGHPNVYLYCGNEPLNGADPSGLDVEDNDPSQEIWKGFAPNGQDKKKAELNAKIYRAATAARTGLATALEVHPLGSLSGAIYGEDCFNEKLTWVQRGVAFLSSVPLIGTFFKGEKIIAKVIKLKRDMALIGGGVLKTNTEIRNLVIIAEGSGIDEVSRLIDQYGGLRKHWKKMKGTGMATDPQTGKRALVEVHWYECHGIGKVELKNKAILQWLDK